jgi:hypothetical protein
MPPKRPRDRRVPHRRGIGTRRSAHSALRHAQEAARLRRIGRDMADAELRQGAPDLGLHALRHRLPPEGPQSEGSPDRSMSASRLAIPSGSFGTLRDHGCRSMRVRCLPNFQAGSEAKLGHKWMLTRASASDDSPFRPNCHLTAETLEERVPCGRCPGARGADARFAVDSPLEESGFELSVPPETR